MQIPNPSDVTLFPAVNAAILNARQEVLLIQRSQTVRAPGVWCLPGGHLDPGESLEQAVRREVFEELGVKLGPTRLVGVYSDPSVNVFPHPRAPKGWGQFVTALFLFEGLQGVVTPDPGEVADWAWCALGAAPKPFLEAHRVRLRDIADFRGEAFIR